LSFYIDSGRKPENVFYSVFFNLQEKIVVVF